MLFSLWHQFCVFFCVFLFLKHWILPLSYALSLPSVTRVAFCCRVSPRPDRVPCVVSSLLQGARLCLLRRAGGDGDGPAVRQGPGRPLLRQPGPRPKLDGHGSLDLAAAPETQPTRLPVYLPVCVCDWRTVGVTRNTSTWPDPRPLACWADHLGIMSDGQITVQKHERVQKDTSQTLVGRSTSHSQHGMHTSQFSENEQDSRGLLLHCIHARTCPPLFHTDIDSIPPQSQTCKTSTGSISPKLIVSLIIKLLNWFFFFFKCFFLWIS